MSHPRLLCPPPHALPCTPSFPELFKRLFLSFDEGLEALVAETEGVLRRQRACQWDIMGPRMSPVQQGPDARSLSAGSEQSWERVYLRLLVSGIGWLAISFLTISERKRKPLSPLFDTRPLRLR